MCRSLFGLGLCQCHPPPVQAQRRRPADAAPPPPDLTCSLTHIMSESRLSDGPTANGDSFFSPPTTDMLRVSLLSYSLHDSMAHVLILLFFLFASYSLSAIQLDPQLPSALAFKSGHIPGRSSPVLLFMSKSPALVTGQPRLLRSLRLPREHQWPDTSLHRRIMRAAWLFLRDAYPTALRCPLSLVLLLATAF